MMLSPIPSGLASHLWQSTLFAAAAGLLALALRRNRAQMRYALWLIASLKFLVPFSLLMAIGSHLKWPAAAVTVHPAVSSAIQQIGQPLFVPDIFNSASHTTAPTHTVPAILLLIWVCGFLVVLASWLRDWLRIRATLRNAIPLSFQAPIKILSSPSLLEPGIFGIFRPVLVLPEGITAHLTPAHLDAILAHELCHVRRRDNLAAAVHMLVEALFWFHPLVWWIGARLVEERERACDEEVLRLGNRPNIYAESILKTCQFYLQSPLTCVSGITGSDLKKRIVRIMSEGLAARLSFRKKLLLAVAGLAALVMPLAVGLTNRSQTSNALPSFEVASVKIDKPTGPEFNDSHWRDRPGKLIATNIRLKDVIERAYNIRDYQISGPDWFKTEHYDIAAEWPSSAPDSQLPLMLQSFLADRFKLAVHREQKMLPLYELRVTKHGPKLQAIQSDGHNSLTSHWGRWSAQDISMSQFAESLSRQTARPVLDKTGLSGFFNFELRFTPDDNGPHMPDQPAQPVAETIGPSIFTAVEEQLGLKLVPKKGPVEILVVDHVERIPTEN